MLESDFSLGRNSSCDLKNSFGNC